MTVNQLRIQYRLFICFISTCLIFFSCKKDGYTPPVVNVPLPATSKTYSADEIKGFEQLALITLKVSGETIAKLPKHVYYYITDTSDAYFKKIVDRVLAEINLLTDTNLVVKRTDDSTLALVKIYFTDTTHFFSALPGAKEAFHSYSYELAGLTLINWDDSNLIYRDNIFIDKDSAERDTSALLFFTYHEIMHSLGMLGHTDQYQFGSVMFVFTLLPYVTDYTYFDKRMIQLLYNPAIKRGMNQQQVEAVLAGL